MRVRRRPLILAAILIGLVACETPEPPPRQDPLPSLQEFMDGYGRDLDAGRRTEVGERYDTVGSLALIDGRLFEMSFEETKSRYLESWTPPVSFAWDTLSYHMLEPETALVLGRFVWVREEADSMMYSYAGFLRHTPQGWRIRAEIETRLP